MTLLARLQAATGPDRELDCAIAVATGKFEIRKNGCGEDMYCRWRDGELICPGNAPDMLVPRFTDSIDCALSWMPEGAYLRSVNYDMHPRMDGRQWFATINFGGHYRGEGRTMQGAINVAIAKARGIE